MSVKQRVGRYVRGGLRRLGYELHRPGAEPPFPIDYDQATIDLYRSVQPYTLTSHERVSALCQAVRYVVDAKVPGDIVECGVWRGGSMLAIAKTLVALGDTERDLHLFDTFTTMPRPGDEDVFADGTRAADLYDDAIDNPAFTYLPMDEVRRLLEATGYPPERLHFVPGMVEDTIPEHAPERLALCRLDTDLYASTKHEMEQLVWRIEEGGVLIVDDYGHFLGAKRAVDEYLAAIGGGALLNRIDFTGRLVVVTPDLHRRAAAHAPAG